MKTERKPFDLETAIQHPEWVRDATGRTFHKVEEREGSSNNSVNLYPVKAYWGEEDEDYYVYTLDGRWWIHPNDTSQDLHLEVPQEQQPFQKRPPLEVGKTYVDAKGRKVRIVCADQEHPSYPCVGLVLTRAGTEYPENYTLYGAAEFRAMPTTNEPRDLLREYDERDQLTPGDLVWVRGGATATVSWTIFVYAGPGKDGDIAVSRHSDLQNTIEVPTWKLYVPGEKP